MKTRTQSRIEVINVIYQHELLERSLNIEQIFENHSELDQCQIQLLQKIANNYQFLKSTLIKLFNTNWQWERVSPLVRAILINAAAEMFSIQPKIVINEAVNITKLFLGNDKDEPNSKAAKLYKFVNAILENYYKLLVKLEVDAIKMDQAENEEIHK
ncbi:transcription antitermination protein NusB [Mycoplasmopsis gallinacea]|uniref:Transcription termination factor n=1 Tax=Mycoplasmopsis gallinacea TaxID=29556 RepID=A0A449A437_9BACT|nr:transcription antitermination protein NusB [Mycoplasmopsis gallinacea]VEU59006.1 transcription termination factor [Mycoplasmopsis gallinacea]